MTQGSKKTKGRRTKREGMTDGWTDGWMDGRTDGWSGTGASYLIFMCACMRACTLCISLPLLNFSSLPPPRVRTQGRAKEPDSLAFKKGRLASRDRPALPFARDTHRERKRGRGRSSETVDGAGGPPNAQQPLRRRTRGGSAREPTHNRPSGDTHICKPRGQQEDTRAPARLRR